MSRDVRRTETLGQDTQVTLPDERYREIRNLDEIIERIEELYNELYDSEQRGTITMTRKIPEITHWEVEAALRDDLKNRKASSNDHIYTSTY